MVSNKLNPSNEQAGYYAKLIDGDLVFQIGWTDIRDYNVDLVSRTLFDFDVTQVSYLKIKLPELEISLERNDENRWMMTQPEEKTVEGNLADNILLAMNALQAESIVEYASSDLSKYQLQDSQFKVTVGLENGENSMLVGEKRGSSYFVKNEALGYIYLVRKNKLEDLMKITKSLVE